ncbi:unnamed protein product [Ranitomeya imitator]|uniref:Prolactin receptor n=1 Tax=Ranitomeya imitator TaxID=111125 RepID=A0ABN9M553_9NEOB|nr:unnamed protein product [Ranitomeya imitator]
MSTPFYERSGFYSAPQTPLNGGPTYCPRFPAHGTPNLCHTQRSKKMGTSNETADETTSVSPGSKECFVWPLGSMEEQEEAIVDSVESTSSRKTTDQPVQSPIQIPRRLLRGHRLSALLQENPSLASPDALHTPGHKTSHPIFSFSPMNSPNLQRATSKISHGQPDVNSEGGTKEQNGFQFPSPKDSGISLTEGDFTQLMEVIMEAGEPCHQEDKSG